MYLLLGISFVSWHSKKQASIKLSTTEAEYVAVGRCCAQIIWMKYQLNDYRVNFGAISIKCDKTNAISLTKNLVLHSQTKHIEVRYYFIRYHVEKGDCVIEHVSSFDMHETYFTLSLLQILRFMTTFSPHVTKHRGITP